jgi:predicted ATPase
MTGVIGDFVGSLLQLDPHETGYYSDAADWLESRVAKGKFKLRGGRQATYPEIAYESDSGVFELYRTSSMVSEVAPIALTLRHLMPPRGCMIIEEPESHLHPASQRLMAQAFGQLVSDGLTIVLTTHSDYFIGELENLIRASMLPKGSLRQLGIKASQTIAREKVALYTVSAPRTGAGSTVRELVLNEDGSFPDSGFAKVTEALYGQTIEIEERLPNP